MAKKTTLVEKHRDLTKKVIVEAALAVLEKKGLPGLTFEAVAAKADMGLRTVFRKFESRELLLDAVGAELSLRLAGPPVPQTLVDLAAYPSQAFSNYDRNSKLTHAALHPELFGRVKSIQTERLRPGVELIVRTVCNLTTKEAIYLPASNICYYMHATTWAFYQSQFGMSLYDTISSAELSMGQILRSYKAKPEISFPKRPRPLPVLR